MRLFLSVVDSTKYVYYFGTTDKNLFISCLFFGYLGMLMGILLEVGSRNPNTKYSPHHFSWSFFLKDNVVKFVTEVILVALFIRFSYNFLGQNINQYVALIIGLGADRLSQIARTDRDKMLPWKENCDGVNGNSNGTNNHNSDNSSDGSQPYSK